MYRKLREHFVCVDSSELVLQGRDGSEIGSQLYVDIVKCSDRVGCKSDEEIKEYFAEKQYFNLLMNQVRFDPDQYKAEAIIKESKIEIVYVGDWQSRQGFQVQMTELSLQDWALDLDELSELSDPDLFTIEMTSRQPRPIETNLV